MDIHNHKQQLESYQMTIEGQKAIIKDLEEKLDIANKTIETWYKVANNNKAELISQFWQKEFKKLVEYWYNKETPNMERMEFILTVHRRFNQQIIKL